VGIVSILGYSGHCIGNLHGEYIIIMSQMSQLHVQGQHCPKIMKRTQRLSLQIIGGFNQRQGEALFPQIFLTLKFVVCIALKFAEIVAT